MAEAAVVVVAAVVVILILAFARYLVRLRCLSCLDLKARVVVVAAASAVIIC